MALVLATVEAGVQRVMKIRRSIGRSSPIPPRSADQSKARIVFSALRNENERTFELCFSCFTSTAELAGGGSGGVS